MIIQIPDQAFFALLNKADKEGVSYEFVRQASVNEATAQTYVQLKLVSADWSGPRPTMVIHNSGGGVTFFLEDYPTPGGQM